MLKSIFSMLIILLVLSCKSDESVTNDVKKMDLVTGIILKDGAGNRWGELGNPNINISYEQFDVFPNPAINSIQVTNNINNQITDIWFVKSLTTKKYNNIDFEVILYSDMYSISEIESKSILSFNNLSSTNLIFNLSSLEAGYYKIFIKSNNIIYWDNIYVNKNGIEISELENFWNSNKTPK